jgi:hypothetical protein
VHVGVRTYTVFFFITVEHTPENVATACFFGFSLFFFFLNSADIVRDKRQAPTGGCSSLQLFLVDSALLPISRWAASFCLLSWRRADQLFFYSHGC